MLLLSVFLPRPPPRAASLFTVFRTRNGTFPEAHYVFIYSPQQGLNSHRVRPAIPLRRRAFKSALPDSNCFFFSRTIFNQTGLKVCHESGDDGAERRDSWCQKYQLSLETNTHPESLGVRGGLSKAVCRHSPESGSDTPGVLAQHTFPRWREPS